MRTVTFKWFSFLAVALIVAFMAGYLCLHKTSPATPVATASNSLTPIATPRASPIIASGNAALDERLRRAAHDLAGAQDAAARSRALALLKQALASGSTNEVSAAIRRILDSKLDTPTGLGFKIGKGGFLKTAPTLRTWLLDYLGQIDPTAAAEYAKVILSTPDSPDEWALALRNLALVDSSAEARALLLEKTGELLANQTWQQNPSAGYLEAFDTAVYLGSTDLLPPLTGLVREHHNQAVAHAAYLALDRMVINDPAAMLTSLEADPSLMQGRENTRADYFARADVQNAQQRQILQSYLLNAQISAAELQQFAGIFPNGNYMISANLLTSTTLPNHSALMSRDTVALSVVQQWLADPNFAKVQPELVRIQARLQEFAHQASQ